MGKIHAAKSEIHSINFQDCHKFPWTPVIARGVLQQCLTSGCMKTSTSAKFHHVIDDWPEMTCQKGSTGTNFLCHRRLFSQFIPGFLCRISTHKHLFFFGWFCVLPIYKHGKSIFQGYFPEFKHTNIYYWTWIYPIKYLKT